MSYGESAEGVFNEKLLEARRLFGVVGRHDADILDFRKTHPVLGDVESGVLRVHLSVVDVREEAVRSLSRLVPEVQEACVRWLFSAHASTLEVDDSVSPNVFFNTLMEAQQRPVPASNLGTVQCKFCDDGRAGEIVISPSGDSAQCAHGVDHICGCLVEQVFAMCSPCWVAYARSAIEKNVGSLIMHHDAGEDRDKLCKIACPGTCGGSACAFRIGHGVAASVVVDDEERQRAEDRAPLHGSTPPPEGTPVRGAAPGSVEASLILVDASASAPVFNIPPPQAWEAGAASEGLGTVGGVVMDDPDAGNPLDFGDSFMAEFAMTEDDRFVNSASTSGEARLYNFSTQGELQPPVPPRAPSPHPVFSPVGSASSSPSDEEEGGGGEAPQPAPARSVNIMHTAKLDLTAALVTLTNLISNIDQDNARTAIEVAQTLQNILQNIPARPIPPTMLEDVVRSVSSDPGGVAKRTSKRGPRKCSYCKKTGHTRPKCKERVSDDMRAVAAKNHSPPPAAAQSTV